MKAVNEIPGRFEVGDQIDGSKHLVDDASYIYEAQPPSLTWGALIGNYFVVFEQLVYKQDTHLVQKIVKLGVIECWRIKRHVRKLPIGWHKND